jgi:N-acetyl-anhydromuramyl-L-alanine amidase AmpD
VIHHSASNSGGATSFDAYHRNVRRWDELGYHFVIGNGTETGDGVIEVGSRWAKQKHGAHCKTPDNRYNDHGIGICLVGNFNNARPSAAQLASLNKLLLFLTDPRGCAIPPGRIHTHKDVTHKTECPGRLFSLTAVKRELMLSRGSAYSVRE